MFLCDLSCLTIVSLKKEKLVALCCVTVESVLWSFIVVPLVGLRSVIMIFPYHTHFLFRIYRRYTNIHC